MNHTFKISVESPLLRPGLKIETEVSGKYLLPAVIDLMNTVREINAPAITITNVSAAGGNIKS